jgi:hypothetical protein
MVGRAGKKPSHLFTAVMPQVNPDRLDQHRAGIIAAPTGSQYMKSPSSLFWIADRTWRCVSSVIEFDPLLG